MFGIFKRKTTEPTFGVEKTADGRWAITNYADNEFVKTYSRRRDAVRGAERMGLRIAA